MRPLSGRHALLPGLIIAAIVAVLLVGGISLAAATGVDVPLVHQNGSGAGGEDSSGANDEPDENERDAQAGQSESEPRENEAGENEAGENEAGEG